MSDKYEIPLVSVYNTFVVEPFLGGWVWFAEVDTFRDRPADVFETYAAALSAGAGMRDGDGWRFFYFLRSAGERAVITEKMRQGL